MNVLEMSGATKHNPGRYRERKRASAKPIAAALGPAPKEWVDGSENNGRCKRLLECWNQVVAQDVHKVLNVSHRMLVENTCHLMYKIRRASEGYGKATSGDYAQVSSNLSKMFMTPVDEPRAAEAVRFPDRDGSSRPRAAGGWGELAG